MYALSVQQPFASSIAVGDKTIEWRKRVWNYRGPVVICASKNPRYKLDNGRYLPAGAAVCIVDMVDCRLMKKKDLYAACCEDYKGPVDGYAWVIENPREVEPVPVKGIVAPWPWQGPELVFAAGWHKRMGFTV